VDSFRSQLKGHLSNKKLYIVYVDNNIKDIINQTKQIGFDSNKNQNNFLDVSNCTNKTKYSDIQINTIYSSEIASENFVSFTKALDIMPGNDNNNFYDILSFNMTLKNLIKDTNIQQDPLLFSDPINFFKNNNITKSIYTNLFSDFMNKYEETIKCPFIKKTIELYSQEKFQASSTDSYIINIEKTIDFIDPQEKKNALPVNVDFFVFPAFANFNIENDKIQIVNETRFFIVIAGKFSNDDLFKEFQLGLLYKFVVYFLFMIMFNILLWFILTGLIFYLFGIYFYPLKKILADYEALYKHNVIYLFI